MKLFGNIIAQIKLRTLLFNDSVDKTLDRILNDCLDAKIESVHIEDRYWELRVAFADGREAFLWNRNKYYAWLSSGKIGSYAWMDGRPTARTMLRFKEATEKAFIQQHLKEDHATRR